MLGRFFTRITSRGEIIVRTFSHTEKKIFHFVSALFIVTVIGLLITLYSLFTVRVPTDGGSFREGVIGAPRFINPLLAISDADRDLTTLIYSGLLRATPGGDLVPDLAKSFSVSEDGLVYTFTLKEDLLWHDGEEITSDDVVFTIEKVQDATVKSTKRASWDGVVVEKIDEKTIIFTLARRYSPFLENTTLGILPEHLWGEISSEQFGFSKYNVEPIGSGSYMIAGIKKDSSGIPRYYDIEAFKHFSLGKPFISKVRIYFYANADDVLDAFNKHNIDTVNAIDFGEVGSLNKEKSNIITYVLPRVFGVFFNQNQNTLFTNISVRRALEHVLDRDTIIQEVLLGFGTPIDGPLPPGSLGFTEREEALSISTTTNPRALALEGAQAILERDGWKINEETGVLEQKTKKGTTILSFSITTSDVPELKNTALMIKERWEELGAEVELKIFNVSDLNRTVIRPRKYDALFFGEIIGRESDPFAFWHSSQRNDPGLNIALYTNITADRLLVEGRENEDRAERIEIYRKFQEEIRNDVPAVFVYSPDFIYIVSKKIMGIDTGTITVPSERFLDVHTWYIETERQWKFFNK